MPLRLLDLVSAAFRKFVSMLPCGPRRQEARTDESMSRPQSGSNSSPTRPAVHAALPKPVRASSDSELRDLVARLKELRPNIQAQVRAEHFGRAADHIKENVGEAIAALVQVADLAETPAAWDEMGLKLQGVFGEADSSFKGLAEDGFGSGQQAREAVSLFVAAGLGTLKPGERDLLLYAMRTEDLQRLAKIDPRATSAATGAVIDRAKFQLLTRKITASQNFEKDAGDFVAINRYTVRADTLEDLAPVLLRMDQSLAALRAHHSVTGEAHSQAHERLRTQVGEVLGRWLQKKPPLGALQPQELARVGAALERFGAQLPQELLEKLDK